MANSSPEDKLAEIERLLHHLCSYPQRPCLDRIGAGLCLACRLATLARDAVERAEKADATIRELLPPLNTPDKVLDDSIASELARQMEAAHSRADTAESALAACRASCDENAADVMRLQGELAECREELKGARKAIASAPLGLGALMVASCAHFRLVSDTAGVRCADCGVRP